MIKSRGMAGITMVAALALAAEAQASSIGLQFTGDTEQTTGTAIGSNQAGVSPQQYWNSYAPTTYYGGQSTLAVTSGVLNSGSGASGLTFTLGYENGAATGSNDSLYSDAGAKDLYSGFVTGNSGNSDHLYVDLSLPATYQSSGYDVYVYATRSNTVPQETVGINTTGSYSSFDQTGTIAGDATATTYLLGSNYIEFTGLTSSTLDVVLFESPTNSTGYLSGIQIVQAPEPSCLGIIMIGGAGLLARRRRGGALSAST